MVQRTLIRAGWRTEANGDCDQGTAIPELSLDARGSSTLIVVQQAVLLLPGFSSSFSDNYLVIADNNRLDCENAPNETEEPVQYYYMADVMSANDYYPFGMGMVGRKYSADVAYRYGFNGQEGDSDVHSLTAYDYGFRIYNPSIARFLSVDPLTQSYPWYTPYQFAGNKPIKFIDLDGLEEIDVAINGNPNGTDNPGSAKLTISIDYQVVTQGIGAVGRHGSNINPTTVQNNYSKGNTTLRMLSLPTPSAPATYLTDKQEKLAIKAEAGDKKALAKLQAQNLQYYKVDVEYYVTISNVANCDLQTIMADVDANPNRNGVVMDPIPNGSKNWGNGSYIHAGINDLAVNANAKFAEAAATGDPAEGYGSIFGLLGREANVVIFNPASLTLGENNILTHEIGHNITNLGHDRNGNGNYEYTQTGLQSNLSGSIYPTKENTKAIINDPSNRSTIKAKPNDTP